MKWWIVATAGVVTSLIGLVMGLAAIAESIIEGRVQGSPWSGGLFLGGLALILIASRKLDGQDT